MTHAARASQLTEFATGQSSGRKRRAKGSVRADLEFPPSGGARTVYSTSRIRRARRIKPHN
jgi:hypothetical protein